MERDNGQKVVAVEAQKDRLMGLYREVFTVLNGIDRSKYSAEKIAMLDLSLEPPDQIPFAKVVAVLKAVIGSAPGVDKLQLESYYSEKLLGKDQSVGQLIEQVLQQTGLNFGDLDAHIHTTGWTNM